MSNYWAERMAKAQSKLTDKNIADTEKQLARYYRTSQQKIIGQFEKVYQKVFSQIAEGKEVTPADLYKLDSYWKMQGQLQQELQKLGDKQAELLGNKFTQQYQSVYDGIALPSGDAFSSVNKDMAQQMINQIWCADGKSWSQRVWDNTDKLQQALNDNLIDCVLTGKKPSELKQLLQSSFGASYSRADTVVRTELAHIQTQAAKDRYQNMGVEQVEVLADEDERRCKTCGKLHGTRYPVNATMPVPAHPNCRCCIIPVVEDNEENLEIFVNAGYNDNYEPCFNDNIEFETDDNVKRAIESLNTNFVTKNRGITRQQRRYYLYGVYAENIKPINGFYDIKAHGTYKSIDLFETTIDAKTLAKIIIRRKDYIPGTPIRLLSCNVGKRVNGKCFAQDLANILNTTVLGADKKLYVNKFGQFCNEEGELIKYGKIFKGFKPQGDINNQKKE